MKRSLFHTALGVAALSGIALSHAAARAESTSHANHVAAFLGGTTADSHTAFTLGADYERRLSELFGAGAFFEHIFHTPAENTAAASLYVHPWEGLKFNVSPGAVFGEEHTSFLMRVGAGYDAHVNFLTVTPTVAGDFISGGHTAVVYGLAIGTGF